MNKSIIIIFSVFFLVACGNKKHSIVPPAGKATSDSAVSDSVVSDSADDQPETVKDIDGNVYNTVKIGKHTWMKENLKTTRFNDGTPIRLVTNGSEWSMTTQPSFCWYNNEPDSYRNLYGALYNGFVVMNTKLCPEFWHVPGDAEWSALSRLMGGDRIAGGKLKAAGLDFWVKPNTAADNSSGFTALPAGLRYLDGVFRDFGFSAYFWTSEVMSPERLWFRYMDYSYSDLFKFNNSVHIGFSVRCVRDY